MKRAECRENLCSTITSNTKAEHIYSMYRKDYPKLMYHVKRMLSKVKATGCYFSRWHNPIGQEYRITVNALANRRVRHLITPVGGAKGHEGYYIVDDYKYQVDNRGMAHLTYHYMRRYMQRGMNIKLYSEENVLKHYFQHNVSSVILWKNDDKTQYICATRTGLSLCRRDPDTNICHFCTFVSMRQLHADQRDAYDKVKEILDLDEQLFNGSITENSEQFHIMDNIIEQKARDLTLISQQIIQQYKDEMDEPL